MKTRTFHHTISSSFRPRGAALLALAGLAFGPAASANSGGAQPGHAGGSLPGERLCSVCHTNAEENAGSGEIALLINGVAADQYAYAPGESVEIQVQATDENAVRFGFQLAARSGTGCTSGGVVSAGSGVRIRENPAPVECASTPGELQWATHSRALVGTSVEFAFGWTAPEAGAGPVTFALAVLAADGDGRPRGDAVYSTSAVVAPQAEAPQPPPMISATQGVILGDSHSMTERGAPGALAAVRGTDFIEAAAEEWVAFQPELGFPTMLAGACVTLNGVKAPIRAASPDRIDFQIPNETPVGNVNVQVIRDCETPTAAPSNTAVFPVGAVQPAILRLSGDRAAAAAVHADGTPVGPKQLLHGVETSPAAPGEVVSLFATGLGAVTPPLATGNVARAERKLASVNVQVSIGEAQIPVADMPYVGTAPGFLGTYRLDVRVPADAASGLHPVSLTVDNVASPAGPSLIVGSPPESAAVPTCVDGGSLLPGQSCSVTIDGVEAVLGLEVDGSQACVCVPARNIERCGAEGVALEQYEIGATKGEAGAWTVSAPPVPPPPATTP